VIESLQIENIGPYRRASVEFGGGKVAILGDNGAGKTTLAKCVVMALQGEGSRYILDGNLGDFIRTGEPSGSVELDFEVAGDRYTVRREWRRSGSNSAELQLPSGDVVEGITRVGNEIDVVLGTPSKAWLDLVWARQGEISDLLKGDEEVFDRLLGISDLEEAWGRLREVSSSIDSDLDRELGIIAELEKGCAGEDELRSRVRNLQAEIESEESELSNIELEDIPKSSSEIREEMGRVGSRLDTLEGEASELRRLLGSGGDCPLCGQEIGEEHRGKLEGSLEDIEARVAGLREAKSELSSEAERASETESSNREAERNEARIRSSLDRSRQLLEEIRSRLSRLEEIKRSAEAHREEADRLRRESDLLDLIREGYRGAQTRLRRGRLRALERGVAASFSRMFGGRFSDFRISGDYRMTVLEGGRERGIHTVSGGESIALAIALRLSIVDQIGGQDLLILDEPTSHLDDTRVAQLSEVLEEIRTGSQVLLITHDELLAGSCDSSILVERRDGRSSVVVG
jgi:DNA repair exonuclease SbcCD ATPase subunit